MLNALKRLTTIGTQGISEQEKKRVVLVNSGCLFLIAISTFYFFFWMMKGHWFMSSTNVFMISSMSFLVWLNSKGFRTIPKFSMIMIISTALFMAADMFGKGINFHFSLFPIAAYSALLFDPKEKRNILLAISYPIILFAIIVSTEDRMFPNMMGEAPAFIPLFGHAMNGLILIFTTYYLYRSSVKAEGQLDEARANAIYSSKMVSLGEMAGGIAHEIRTPLQFMTLKAQAMQRQNGPDEFTDQIIENCSKMSKIITSLTNISHFNIQREVKKVNLKTVIDDVLVISRHRLTTNNIQLEINVPENLPEITCNQIEIGQVIINLLNNAIDAMEGMSAGVIKISATADNGLKLFIENNGPLIPAHIRTRIFDDFFTTKALGKGTGLGLSISKKLMLANDGKLFLDESSESTRFICHLK